MTRARRLRSVGVTLAVVTIVAAIAFAATRANGREGTEAFANDGGAWLLKRDAGAIGHLNREVLEVTAGVRVAEPGSDFDVDQAPNAAVNGAIVVHDRDARLVLLVDPRTHATRGSMQVPATARANATKAGVVVWQPEPLRVWALTIDEALAITNLADVEPDHRSDAPGLVSVGLDDVTVYDSGTSSVSRLGDVETTSIDDSEPLLSLTTVGARTAATTERTLVIADEGEPAVTVRLDADVTGPIVLQQPSPDAETLTIVDADARLHRIDLATMQPMNSASIGATGALPPIVHEGCVFVVATTPPTFTRACGDRIHQQPLTGAGSSLRLRLVNGWVWINDLDSGGAWLTNAETDLARIDDWGAALAEDTRDESDATSDSAGGIEELKVAPDSSDAELLAADERDEDGENEPPIARDDEVHTRTDRPVVVAVLRNDEDVDGDVLLVDRVESVGDAAGAQVWVTNGRDAIQVTPAAGFNGTIRFAYQVSDGRGGSAEAIATVVVSAGTQQTNRPPMPVTDVATVRAGQSVSLNVLANDTDPDGDALVLQHVSAESGTVVHDPSGQMVFTPDLAVDDPNDGLSTELTYVVADDYGATAEGRVRVRVRLAEANGAPDARNDAGVTSAGRTVQLRVLANDTDPDNDALIVARQPVLVSAASDPGAGAVLDLHVTADGDLTFVPEAAGVYVFEYLISDGQATDAAQIRIDVSDAATNLPPTPARDDITIPRGATRLVRVLDNDGDPNGDVVSIVEWSTTDGLSVEEVPGVGFRVTVLADAPDRASFRYAISDGIGEPVGSVVVVSAVDVRTVNQPPIVRSDTIDVRPGRTTTVPVLLNDYDPEGGSLEVLRVSLPDGIGAAVKVGPNGQTLSLALDPTVTSGFRVSYDVADEQGAIAAAVVDVRLVSDAEPNRPPVARPDVGRTEAGRTTSAESEGLTMPVLANDTDPDGDTLTIEGIAIQPGHGSAALAPDGTVTYRPDPGFTGTDQFTYVILDTEGARAVGHVLVGVARRPEYNRAPAANDDTIAVLGSDAAVELDVLSNDHDPDGDRLTVVEVSQPAQGTLNLTDDGRLLFLGVQQSPGTSDPPTLSFLYTVSDGNGNIDDAVVRLEVESEASQPPVAADDVAGPSLGNRSITVDVLANDVGLGPLTLSSTDPSVSVSGGQLRVTVGVTSSQHTYTVTDAAGMSDTATVTVFVVDNASPIVTNLSTKTAFDLPLTLTLAAQVTDPDDDPLFFVCCDNALGGVVDILQSAAGTLDVRFVPSPGFVGPAGFSYSVDDQAGHVVAGHVGIVVQAPANRPPVVRPGAVGLEAGTSVPFHLDSLIDDPDLDDTHRYAVTGTASTSVSAELSAATLRLTAAANAAPGNLPLTFRVTDAAGQSAEGTVTVTITQTSAEPPRAVDDHARTHQGTPVIIRPTVNDLDPLGGGLTLRQVGSSAAGAAAIEATDIRFAPASDFFGTTTLTYTLRDAADIAEREAVGQITIDVIGRPAVPAAPNAVAGNANATVAWSTPVANGSVVDGYRLEVSTSEGVRSIDLPEVNSHSLASLVNGTDHQFRVSAHNEAGWGEWSAWSAPVRPDTRPDAPAAPTSAFGDEELVVSWTPPTTSGSAITGYRLEIGGGVNQIVPVGAVGTYIWRGLQNGTEFQFRVAAVNAAGVSDWSRWSVNEHPLGAPFAPAAPMVTRGNRFLDLDWATPSNNGDPIGTYDIEMRSTGQTLTVAAGAGTNHRWANLTNGVAQEFRVRANNRAPIAGAWSPWSAPVVPCSVPDAPTAPNAARGDGQVSLSWSAPSDQGCGLAGYNLRASGGVTTFVQTAGAGASSHTFTGLTNGVAYSFEVQATNSEGTGPWSPASAAVTPAGPPSTPSILSATATNRAQITLTWSPANGNGTPITGFEVSIDNGTPSVAPGTTHTATGLGDNTSYSFRVRACNAVSCGAWSSSAAATTWGPPTAPRSVGATAGNGTWQLSWSTPASDGGSPVSAYEFRINSGAPNAVGPGTFSYDLPGAVNGSTYTGEVRACSVVGCGPWAAASATPTAPPPVVTVSIGGSYSGAGCLTTCHWIQLNASNFIPGASVSVQCFDTLVGRFKTGTAIVGGTGTISSTPCFYGYDGETVWITVNGVESNRILWP